MSSPKLPDAKIVASLGPINGLFARHGLTSFGEAVACVGSLPYGRTTDRAEYTLVLTEGRGACSGKHALLAALAKELGLPVVLTIGIYEMDDANTPGIGAVLERAGLASIPEAHCYLSYNGQRFDVTRGSEPQAPTVAFLVEEVIAPSAIGEYKVAFHRRFLAQWLTARGTENLEHVWRTREACIQTLAGRTPS